MYGMRYLSIVDSRFVKIALGLAWILPLLMTISSYFGFKDEVGCQKTCMKGYGFKLDNIEKLP